VKVTSHDIKAGLKKAFPPPGWQVFFEVGDDTGSRVSRHADAVAMGIWPSNGHAVHGFEIKVSRADFLSELKDPTKSQAVFKFCNRWSVVTPTGLIKAEELPATWGWMTFDGSTMRTVKQAPMLKPEALTAGFVAAMLRRAGEADNKLLDSALHSARQKWSAETEDRVRKGIENHKAKARDTAEVNARKLAAYESVFGTMSQWEIEALAPYLSIAQAIGKRDGWHEFRNAINTVVKTAATLSDCLRTIDEDLL
jgi:hypothetical protein